jgi:hypothetical protein
VRLETVLLLFMILPAPVVLLLLLAHRALPLLRRLSPVLAPAPLPPTPSAPSISAVPARSNRLVAILPDVGGLLDYTREKRILREASGPWELVILEWGQATREGIARELREGGARLLYFGGHGVEDRALLSAGEDANRSWLGRIISQHSVEAVVLNACLSDGLASACLNAGARVVVATAGPIADSSAGSLATAFIDGLARPGTTAAQAVGYALASVDDATAEMVRLRGDGSWLWERRSNGLK